MNLLATKNIYHISASINKKDCPVERELVDKATVMMGDLIGDECTNGCDDDYEYYMTLGSNDYTIKEIQETWKIVKAKIKLN